MVWSSIQESITTKFENCDPVYIILAVIGVGLLGLVFWAFYNGCKNLHFDCPTQLRFVSNNSLAQYDNHELQTDYVSNIVVNFPDQEHSPPRRFSYSSSLPRYSELFIEQND